MGGFAKKFKRKRGSEWRKSQRKNDKKKRSTEVKQANLIRYGVNTLKKVKDSRVGIQLMCFIDIMYYEFHADIQKLRQLPQYIDDIQWYLSYSYNEKGKLIKKPSFTLLDCCLQTRREKHYTPIVRTAVGSDDLTQDIIKTLVHLELQLLWIVVWKFDGFGKIRLERLQKRLQEREQSITWDEQVALREKLWNELCFSFDECTLEDFNTWSWATKEG